jgi:hypothetical protein
VILTAIRQGTGMLDQIKIEVPSDESDKMGDLRMRRVYQILLVASIIGNIVLSFATYFNKVHSERLDDEKKALDNKFAELTLQRAALENRIQIYNNSPTFSIFRLIYEMNSFSRFIDSHTQPPFLSDNKNFRIIENSIYENVKRDLTLIHRQQRLRSQLKLLVIANTSSSPAFALKITLADSSIVELGDVEPHTAVLIPVTYKKDDNSPNTGSDNFSQLIYDVRLGGDSAHQNLPIPGPVTTSWTPLLTDPAGVGRASVDDDRDKRLDETLPP